MLTEILNKFNKVGNEINQIRKNYHILAQNVSNSLKL